MPRDISWKERDPRRFLLYESLRILQESIHKNAASIDALIVAKPEDKMLFAIRCLLFDLRDIMGELRMGNNDLAREILYEAIENADRLATSKEGT